MRSTQCLTYYFLARLSMCATHADRHERSKLLRNNRRIKWISGLTAKSTHRVSVLDWH